MSKFTVELTGCRNSVSYIHTEQGVSVTIYRDLPIEVDSYEWEGDTLILECSWKSPHGRLAWPHTLDYLQEQLLPIEIVDTEMDRPLTLRETLALIDEEVLRDLAKAVSIGLLMAGVILCGIGGLRAAVLEMLPPPVETPYDDL